MSISTKWTTSRSYDKPFLKFERLIETYLSFAPRGFAPFRMAIPLWLREKLLQKNRLRREIARLGRGRFDADARLLFTEHHQSHAASAFFASPFERPPCLPWTESANGPPPRLA
jgi:carbamoyltransferase